MRARDSQDKKFKLSFCQAEKFRSEGKFEKAIKEFSLALELAQNLNDRKKFDSLLGMARCQSRLGRQTEAEKNYKQVLAFLRTNQSQKNSQEIATILWEMAVLYTEQKRYHEAALTFKNAIVLIEKNDKFVADCLWGLSKCFCAMGRFNAAEESIRQALEIYEKYGNQCTSAIIINKKNLASILIEKSRLKEAISEIDRAFKYLNHPLAIDHDDFAKIYFRAAWQGQSIKEYKLAEKALKKALDLTRRSHGHKNPIYTLARLAVAHNKICLGKYVEAEKILLESISHLRKLDLNTFKPDIYGSLYELGMCYMKQKQIRKAIKVLEELLSYLEEEPLLMPELFADTLHSLAQCHELDCNLAKAKELNQRSIFIKEQIYGVMHEEVAQTLFQLSSCLIKLDDRFEADFAKIRASEITDALYSSS